MEERSPGGFSPTKWAQFANSPRPGRREPAAGGGARWRLRPGPPALLPPGARSRPDFPGGGARRRGRGRRRGAAAFSSLLDPFSGLPRLRRGLGTAGDRSPAGRTGGRGQRVKPPPPAPHKQAPPSAARTRTPAATPRRLFLAGERALAVPRAAVARRVGFATVLGSPAGSVSGGGGGGGTGKMAAELLFPPPL